MAISQSRSIILTMTVSFSLSFVVMYRARESQYLPVPHVDAASLTTISDDALHNSATPPSASTPPSAPIPSETLKRRDNPTLATPAAGGPEPLAQAPESGAESLPIAFHIRDRRDLNRIEGDIRNISGQPMAITLRAVSANTHASSEMSFDLAPGERKAYSTDDGLTMQADDELIVQSPPYQDRIVRVP